MNPPCRPLLLPSYTPSELLDYLVDKHRHPTTIVIGFPREVFSEGLLTEVQNQFSHASLDDEDQTSTLPAEEGDDQQTRMDASQHPLVRGSLMMTAVSRHIRFVFTPTITHLRTYLTVFSASTSRIPPPPALADERQQLRSIIGTPPLLLVYGFLELHRGTTEWSAQGLGDTMATLVEASATAGFQAAVGEPRGAGGHEDLEGFLGEKVVILNSLAIGDESRWRGRQVEVRKVLKRWCALSEEAE